jgi:hypothetical protein
MGVDLNAMLVPQRTSEILGKPHAFRAYREDSPQLSLIIGTRAAGAPR